MHVGSPEWKEKMDVRNKIKQFGLQTEHLNKMIIRPKKENGRYQTPQQKTIERRKPSVIFQDQGSQIISPRNESKNKKIMERKITWRNESDYINQIAKGRVMKRKDTQIFENLNYGERYNKNVFDDEYKKNLYAAQK